MFAPCVFLMTFISNPSHARRVTNLQRLALWVLVGCVCSLGSISNGFASIVVSYDLTGQDGKQDFTAGVAAAGIVADNLARGSGLNNSKSQTDTITAAQWSGQATDYFSFGLTVDAATTVSLDTINIRTQSSDKGPGTLGLFYSTDGFATSSEIGTSLFSQPGITPLDSSINLASIVPLQNLSNVTVDFRIIQIGTGGADGGASNPSGGFSIANFGGSSATPFTISGTINAIPEVASPLVLMGVLAAAAIFRRRR